MKKLIEVVGSSLCGLLLITVILLALGGAWVAEDVVEVDEEARAATAERYKQAMDQGIEEWKATHPVEWQVYLDNHREADGE